MCPYIEILVCIYFCRKTSMSQNEEKIVVFCRSFNNSSLHILFFSVHHFLIFDHQNSAVCPK
jgi:hypothetical protein